VIFFLIFIGLISYYLYDKLGPAWKSEYVWKGISELNNEMGENLKELFAISQITFADKDMQAYELLMQNEIKRLIQEYFGSQLNTFYIQSAMKLTYDISWDEFEDIIEPASYGNKMFASNINVKEPGILSKQLTQDQVEENIESDVVIPSKEDLEAVIEQLAYNLIGDSSHNFSIGYNESKLDDYINVDNKTSLSDNNNNDNNNNNDSIPIPEPSTLLLAGSGLLFLTQWFRRSRMHH